MTAEQKNGEPQTIEKIDVSYLHPTTANGCILSGEEYVQRTTLANLTIPAMNVDGTLEVPRKQYEAITSIFKSSRYSKCSACGTTMQIATLSSDGMVISVPRKERRTFVFKRKGSD